MSRKLIALLVITNLGTGYELYRHKMRYEAAVSDKTTDREREVYGAACVEWLNEKAKEGDITLALGRSWKKHGQMVFEVIPASDKDWKTARENIPEGDSPFLLCTYDKQSGLMYPITGDERKRWMFY